MFHPVRATAFIALARVAIFLFAWRVSSRSDFGWVSVEMWSVYAMLSWTVIGLLAASSTFWSHCGVGTTMRLLESIA
jgi:hypothetical protein